MQRHRFPTPVFLQWVCMLWLALAAMPALASPAPLVLDDAKPQVEGWPAATILHDPAGTLLAEALVPVPERFAIPQGAYATAGMHPGASWLRVPALVAAGGGDGNWILRINFGVLKRVDFFLIADGRIVQRGVFDRVQGSQGALGGPRPAFAMHLVPGVRYEVLLRVETLNAIILPISFEKPEPFYAETMDEQLVQGLFAGLTLVLLLYSLAQWISLRDSLFAKYALLVGGLAVYNLTWFGYDYRYLWHYNAWAVMHMPGVMTLLTAVGGYLFVEHVLARPGRDRIFSRLMKSGATACLISALAWSFDLIEMHTVVNIIITLGVLPMLLGLPGAFRRARQGDAVGIYFLVGWTVSFTGSAVAGQMCTGVLPFNYWTNHLVEFSSTFDMLVFMRILGLRTKDIQDAMVRAEAATRLKSEFLANMSHEIRTPMNAIIGMSRLALMGNPEPKLRNYLSKILGAGEHLLGIINDILDFSKIEAGRLALEKTPFDLGELLEHLSSVTALKTDARRVELVFSVPRGVPTQLVGDPLRLGQVLINLTNNAVKFTDEGEIVVAVDLAERDAATGEVVLEFSVSDTGIGMDAGQLGHLFESFTQADSSISRKYGGTGLGLSISKQLVELMGGRIEVASTPGVGSRFSFRVRLGVQDAHADAAATPAAALARMRVLVVDDSASARQALLEMLSAFGVRAEAVGSGDAALARLAQATAGGQPYHVVLMDYLMPGMDGVEAIRRIRADARLHAPPAILMVSACTRDSVLQRESELQHQLPLSGFLTKPVGPALLYDSLLQVLRPDLAHANAPARSAPQDLARLDGARILLVDDNANNREVALDFLAAARMQVDSASGGQEAVQMAAQGDYDLVLMDIQMQEVDGFAATRLMRALPHCAQLPIVAMTAHAMAGDREKSLAAGMNDHVAKPIDPELMFRALLKWIDPQRLVGRALPARAAAEERTGAAPDGVQGALPAPLRGVDWERALVNAGSRPERLERRIDSFVREYASAPQRMREALADGNDALLHSLAHNLKSGASYLGAEPLAGAAGTLELALRAGRREHLALLVPDLIVALEAILAGLARGAVPAGAAATAPATAARPAPLLAPLLARLDAYLVADDARAEDALDELEAALPDAVRTAHGARIGALRRAVREIEYEAARAHLGQLVRQLEDTMETQA
ncbi:hybrid sensor histidine kinase/response regulator [Massilia sp. 9096]|uniref:hybrid sensor histidine kinase/response regulator n=1 Tax=Massilia sp. 9096 TaxID=1500894 RepID=UPI000564119B|nr:hybrid sensor histidine kinase/response regulator [Massilia sp. 9096]